MICQHCQLKAATIHVTDLKPSGRPVEFHTCAACFVAKNGTAPSVGPKLARLRFSLSSVLIVIAVFAVSNGLMAGLIGLLPQSQTPEQRRRNEISAAIMINSCLAIGVMYRMASVWLRRVGFDCADGEARQATDAQQASDIRTLTWFAISSVFAFAYVFRLLVTMSKPGVTRLEFGVSLVLALIVPAILGLWWNDGNTRHWLSRIKVVWKDAVGAQRVWVVTATSWPMGVGLLVFYLGPILPLRHLNPWSVPPAVLFIVLLTRISLLSLEVFSQISVGASTGDRATRRSVC